MVAGDKTFHHLNPVFQLMKDIQRNSKHTFINKWNDWFSYWWERTCQKSDENGNKSHYLSLARPPYYS